jgi:hypothetical protein
MEYNIGLAFGWLAWTVVTTFVILAGVLSLIILSIYNKDSLKNELSSSLKEANL